MVSFARETLQRLPLADAAYHLLDYVLQEPFLDDVFQQHRGASYEKVITFPLFVHLIGDALLEHRGSGRQSFRRAQEDHLLQASLKAMYGKLARLPLSLSLGFFQAASQRLLDVCPAVAATSIPDSLREFTIRILDGKKIKHVAHRLKILREVKGQVLAAKIAAGLDMQTGLVIAFNAHPDGETNDAPLVPPILEQARLSSPRPLLWVEDRQYCDLVQPSLIRATGDHYLIRYHPKVGFHPDPERPGRWGVDGQGRKYWEEWGWLGSAKDRRRQEVRRITLYRPGEEDVILVTDLLDGERYPAVDLLVVYLQRWGIERVFQRITEVFHLRTLIGTTPQAGVFQAAFCLLLYNVLVVLRGYLSEAQQRQPETISTENLFYDVQRQWVSLHEVLSMAEIAGLFEKPLPAADLCAHLRGLLAEEWSERWLKAPSKRKKSALEPVERKRYLKGGHSSVYRLLQEARQRRQKAEPLGRK